MKGQGSWLRLLISLGIAMLILFALVKVGGVGLISQHFKVTGSGGNLLGAIENVHQCVKEKEGGFEDSDCYEIVNVSLPQDYATIADLEDQDPKWLIFYGGSNYQKKDIAAVDKEVDFGIENEDIKNDECPESICYGLVKRHVTEDSKMKLDKEIREKLRPFWLISPCHARVKVYYEEGADEIRVCNIKDLGDRQNFCWSEGGEGWVENQDDDWSCENNNFLRFD